MRRRVFVLMSIGLSVFFLQTACVKNVKPLPESAELPSGQRNAKSGLSTDHERQKEEGTLGAFSEGIGEDGLLAEGNGGGIQEERGGFGTGSLGDGARFEEALMADLSDVFFDFNRAALKREAEEILRKNARNLLLFPNVNILISGHTDERGSNEYNLALGERRARTVKHFLEAFGVKASRIETISYGEENPFCMDSEEACWRLNRRAHFFIKPRG
ncbi:MAG: peptidoglycan-associated lipoprotein Pal [Nitrospiria bacterium]